MPASHSDPAARIDALVGPGTRFTGPGSGGVAWRASTGSTNADLAAAVRAGRTGFGVLVADHQDAGRGRFARDWCDAPGTAALISMLIPNDRPMADWGWLSMVAGLAVTEAVEQTTGAGRDRVTLKWPNDVLVDAGTDDGGKLCGILSERVEGPAGAHAVVGIGLNVSMDRSQLPVPTATSLSLCGLAHDRDALVAAIVRAVDRLLDQWLATGTVREAYRRRCDTIGTAVRLTFGAGSVGAGGAVEGTGVDVGVDGAIVVESPEGRRSYRAGDVQHLRPAGADLS